MGQKHKHAEVIKAWADGAKIEHRPLGGVYWLAIGGTPNGLMGLSIGLNQNLNPIWYYMVG